MDLKQTGLFIQEQRKIKKLTQVQLALKLNVSEKTISKWECGKGFPDTSLILPLCKELGISANELLSARKLPTEKEYKETAEKNLIVLKSQQQKNVKHLLLCEWALIWLGMVILLSCCIVSAYANIPTIYKVLLIVFGFINITISIIFSLIIETKAGFYKCSKCKHTFIPSYKQTVWSMHMGRTRYMKCPCCEKKSWCKKVISEEQ